MRIYSISMMVLSALVLAFIILCFFIDLIKINNIEVAVKGNDYKKFISHEYFKQQEFKNSIDSKYGPDLTKLTEADWIKRWDTFKDVTLKEETHKRKVDMVEELVSFLVFGIIFIGHYFLFRRCERATMK